MTLYDWFKMIMDAKGFAEVAKTGTITMLSIAGDPAAEWKFERGWPIAYSVADLDIADGSVVTETLKLTHEYLERTK